MSIECKVCGTIWVHQQKKCPKCGADSNGRQAQKTTVFSLLQPALEIAPDPVDTPRTIDAGDSSSPSSDSYSSGGGDFGGGGGGSDW